MLNEAIEVRHLSKKQRMGEKGSSSKLTLTPSPMLIPLSSHAPKAQDVESFHFHGLRETITISNNDFFA